MNYAVKECIRLAIEAQALQFGQFELKSGRVSPYFFNAGKFCNGYFLSQISEYLADLIHHSSIHFQMLFGSAYKGIPLVSSVCAALYNRYEINYSYTYNRKEKKDHGEGGEIVGAPLSGKVLIIDDVISAGTATKESIAIIKQHGATPIGLITILDRQEIGSRDLFASNELKETYNLSVHSLIQVNDLIEYSKEHPDFQKYTEKIITYQKQYRPKNTEHHHASIT